MKLFVKAICLVLLISVSLCALSSCFLFKKECKHPVKSEWSVDANNHWRDVTCEHTDLKKYEGAHEDTDSDKKCDTCGYDMNKNGGSTSTTPAIVEYTVTVVDAAGAPVEGVDVRFFMEGRWYLIYSTNFEGEAIASFEEGTYLAKLESVPSKYAMDDTIYEFVNNALTITLQSK